jgi:hypothetical protein
LFTSFHPRWSRSLPTLVTSYSLYFADMPRAPVRADTHDFDHDPPCWTEAKAQVPSLTYQQFNEEQYEPWLKKAYADDVKPFFERPAVNFAKYLGNLSMSFHANLVLSIQKLATQAIPELQRHPSYPSLLKKWREMSVTEREDVLLQNWERQQEEA